MAEGETGERAPSLGHDNKFLKTHLTRRPVLKRKNRSDRWGGGEGGEEGERDRKGRKERREKKWNSRMIDVSPMNTNDPARPVNHDEELSDMPTNKDAPRTSAGQLRLIEPAESNWHDPIIYRSYDPCTFSFTTGWLFPPLGILHTSRRNL